MRMWRVCLAATAMAFGCLQTATAQTVESVPYRVVLSTANEVPPVTGVAGSGGATVWLHLVRNASGEVIRATTEFQVSYRFDAATNITAMHIHSGAAGTNGPVVIDSAVTRVDGATAGALPALQMFNAAGSPGLEAVKGILANPSNYYLNMHSTANPAGVIRGQLQKAEMAVRVARINPGNEVPPVTTVTGEGWGTIVAIRSVDAAGNTTSAQVLFDVTYALPADQIITAMHLHEAGAGVNGPVTVDTGLVTAVTVPEAGRGTLRFAAEVDLARAGAMSTLDKVFYNPSAVYLNMHSRSNPAGVVRGQLMYTDAMSFPVTMSGMNEVPPLESTGTVQGKATVYTARSGSGTIMGGAVLFDVNMEPRITADVITYTGLHIHNGPAAANGPVTIDSGLAAAMGVTSATTNLLRIGNVSSQAGFDSLNAILTSPESHYVNLHTSLNPGGAWRSQLAPAMTAMPALSAIISSVSDENLKTTAPGGLITVFGANLAKTATDLSGFNGLTRAPNTLNGTSATIDGKTAPVLAVSPGHAVLQVPVDAEAGMRPVVVSNSNGASAPMMVEILTASPALFFDSEGGIAFKASDNSLVRSSNPAAAGDTIYLLSTGLGLTEPRLGTGQPAADITNLTQPVSARIAGREARVLGSAAAPGMVGIYGSLVMVPAGVPSGMQPVTIGLGNTTSNTVNIAIR